MKTVAFLGSGLGFEPGPPPDYMGERWGLNSLMWMRFNGELAWDRWFDLHPTSHIRARRENAYHWYRQQTKPIYRWERDPEIPASVAYPLWQVDRMFPDETDYGSSICWMFALAMAEGFQAIDLFWFPVMNEHAGQIPSIRYWIGQARGRGARVTIHGRSDLVPQIPKYGLSLMESAA